MEELTDYERYQLQWMIEHGYSIMDLVQQLENLRCDLIEEDGMPIEYNIVDIFNNWQDEIGFKESEIWACQDEWANNEALEEDEKDDNEISSKSSNKMDKICALLGVELFQKFNIVEIYGPNALRDKLDGKIRNPYYFTDEGLVNSSGVCDNHKLANLINGRFKIEISKEQF